MTGQVLHTASLVITQEQLVLQVNTGASISLASRAGDGSVVWETRLTPHQQSRLIELRNFLVDLAGELGQSADAT